MPQGSKRDGIRNPSAPAYIRRARSRSKRSISAIRPRPAADPASARSGATTSGLPVPRTARRKPSRRSAGVASARRSKPFWRSSRPIIHEDGPVVGGIQPELLQQRAHGTPPSGPILAGVIGGERRIGRGVPEVGVEAVEDPEEPVALGTQVAIEAHPERRRERLGGEARADRVHQVRTRRSRPEAGRARPRPAARRSHRHRDPAPAPGQRRPAVVREVVDREQNAAWPIAGSPPGDRSRSSATGPACQSWMWMTSGGRSQPAQCSSAARHRSAEPPRVVRVVAAAGAVQPVAIERRRVVDEMEPVAVRLRVEDVDGQCAGWEPRVGDRDRHGAASAGTGTRDSAAGRRRPARRASRSHRPAREPAQARRRRRRDRRSWPTARTRRR